MFWSVVVSLCFTLFITLLGFYYLISLFSACLEYGALLALFSFANLTLIVRYNTPNGTMVSVTGAFMWTIQLLAVRNIERVP